MCVFIYIELIIPSTVLPTLSAFNEILKAQIEEEKKVLIQPHVMLDLYCE